MPVNSSVISRRWRAVVAAAVGLSAVTAIGVYGGAIASDRPGSAALSRMHATIASLLNGRSPGERAAGILASLKQKRVPPMHEHALSKVHHKPHIPVVKSPPEQGLLLHPPEDYLYNLVAQVPPINVDLDIPPIGTTPGEIPLNAPPGGGGGIINPTGSPPPSNPPNLPSAPPVPEPASWLMMLMGFATIGFAVRRTSAPTPPLRN